MRKIPFISGFTIIEIIIAISIISILVTLSYSSYATFSNRQKLISAGQNLKNLFRDVQSRNFNNEVDCSVCSCDDPAVNSLDGWFVDFDLRQFYGNCQGNNFSITSLNIAEDIVIEASNTSIEFLNSPPRLTDDTSICLSVAGLSDRYYRIDISRSGDISDSGGVIETCTP